MKNMARYSFTGYSPPTWLSKNKESLKAIVVAVAGVATYFLATVKPPELNVAVAGVVAAFVKFAIDALDYWLSQNAG